MSGDGKLETGGRETLDVLADRLEKVHSALLQVGRVTCFSAVMAEDGKWRYVVEGRVRPAVLEFDTSDIDGEDTKP